MNQQVLRFYLNYAQLLAPDFALILTGYLLCRFTALDRRVWEQIDKLVYYFLFPILMFSSIVKTPIRYEMVASFIPAGLLLACATIALAYVLPFVPIFKQQFSTRDHAGAAQIAFRFNSFVGLALVERLVGAPGLLLMAVLLGFCVPLFNVAAINGLRSNSFAKLSSLCRAMGQIAATLNKGTQNPNNTAISNKPGAPTKRSTKANPTNELNRNPICAAPA